ncbi:hypothetical protein BGZ74_005714 [Mortierella antarctica]|nr:hypothetical protein BGZ74_005714 [Mortierella antarctica]
MDESSEGCYCIQAQNCQHWIASITNRRHHVGGMHEHTMSDYDQMIMTRTIDPSSLNSNLRIAMLEIEKQTQLSRDLAHVNQELEESRLLAISDQARTAKRLLLMSSQLEYTEQKLYNLTKQVDDGQKDSDLLRIERIKREALQEREDAGRLRIEALQDELQEVQRSERLLQQKLKTTQTKYETLGKRHDLLRQKQQELELARESKEALAWLKETTDRLCSPPQGSLGQAIKQERTFQETTPIDILHSPTSSSPPYPSSIMDPPLAAQNQLISLIKELATTNSTLRTELTEYRDLLQDARNEVLSLRSQVEDYEQGHFQECCGQSMEDGTTASWSMNTTELVKTGSGSGLDPSGSPPPYMTTPATEQHHHHHIHLPGVRDMDMLDSDDNQDQEDDNQGDDEDPGEQFSDSADSGEEPGFVAAFAEALSFLSFFSGPQLSGSPP